MRSKLNRRALWRGAAALSATGILFGATCTTDQIEAIAIGVEAVASELDHQDDNLSFGEWLADEVRDW